MITPGPFAEAWGPDELVRATPEAAATLAVDEDARSFLVEAGLPAAAPMELAPSRSRPTVSPR